MALTIKKGYAVKPLENLTVNDFKEDGFKIDLIESKTGGQLLRLTKDNVVYMALTAKGFTGKITKDTFVIFGNNSSGEKRMYLTNNTGGKVLTEDFI